MKPVLFLTEGGAGRGSGHVIRSSAVVEALIGLGAEAKLVIDCPSDFQSPFPFSRLEWQQESTDVAALHLDAYSAIFIDSYTLSAPQLRRLAAFGLPIFYLDDLQTLDLPVAAVFSPFPGKAYPKKTGRLLYTGLDYMPMRKAFIELIPPSLEEREGILISFGGSRQDDLIDIVLTALEGCGERLTLVADYPKREGVRILSEQSADEMAALMAGHRLIICAGGGTLNEAARAGTPAIVVKIADNQTHYTDFWKNAGFAVLAGVKGDEGLGSEILRHLRRFSDKDIWRSASAAGAVCDGKGAERIAAIIVKQIKDAEKSVLLHQDYKVGIYFLKNYLNCNEAEHEGILAARNSDAVRLSNLRSFHVGEQVWNSFIKNLASSSSLGYWLVYDGEKTIGSFSLISVNFSEGGAVLGFYKNPNAARKGVGTVLCKLAKQLAFEQFGLYYISAECFESNALSRSSMEKAGFEHCYNYEDANGRSIMHYEAYSVGN